MKSKVHIQLHEIQVFNSTNAEKLDFYSVKQPTIIKRVRNSIFPNHFWKQMPDEYLDEKLHDYAATCLIVGKLEVTFVQIIAYFCRKHSSVGFQNPNPH